MLARRATIARTAILAPVRSQGANRGLIFGGRLGGRNADQVGIIHPLDQKICDIDALDAA